MCLFLRTSSKPEPMITANLDGGTKGTELYSVSRRTLRRVYSHRILLKDLWNSSRSIRHNNLENIPGVRPWIAACLQEKQWNWTCVRWARCQTAAGNGHRLISPLTSYLLSRRAQWPVMWHVWQNYIQGQHGDVALMWIVTDLQAAEQTTITEHNDHIKDSICITSVFKKNSNTNNNNQRGLILCYGQHGQRGRACVEKWLIIWSVWSRWKKRWCPFPPVFWQHYSDELCIAVGVMFTDQSRSMKSRIIALLYSPGILWFGTVFNPNLSPLYWLY